MDPQSIRSKQFGTVLRGYDKDEVDDFLDAIEEGYSDLLRINEELKRKLSIVTDAPTQILPPVPSEQAGRLLELAQATADQHVAEAREAARLEAEKVRAEARAEAEKIIKQGNDERHLEIGRLEEQRSRLQTQIEQLTSTHTDVAAKLQAALEAMK